LGTEDQIKLPVGKRKPLCLPNHVDQRRHVQINSQVSGASVSQQRPVWLNSAPDIQHRQISRRYIFQPPLKQLPPLSQH
jgi:hypothetical protein